MSLQTHLTDEWFFDVTEEQVLSEILIYPNNKAPGYDEVPNCLYKAVANSIAQPLCYIFNLSARSGIFPTCWKHAKVVALPKCKNPAINDLRPISLLPFCAKIFEKLIFKNSKRMFIDNFGPHQYGFRPHSSTCNALISLHDHITSHCDSKGATGVEVIAFDFSKAFDKLNHNTILSRLFLCKFPIALIRWITSYFSNRTQHVCLGNWVSNIVQVTSACLKVVFSNLLSSHLSWAIFNQFIPARAFLSSRTTLLSAYRSPPTATM